MDNETLKAMRELLQEQKQELDQMMDEKLKPIHEKLDIIEEKVEINRHTGNLLLKWAERAEHAVNVGLYEE